MKVFLVKISSNSVFDNIIVILTISTFVVNLLSFVRKFLREHQTAEDRSIKIKDEFDKYIYCF